MRDAQAIAHDIHENAGAYWNREISYEAFTERARALWDEANLYQPLCIAGTPAARFSGRVHAALRNL